MIHRLEKRVSEKHMADEQADYYIKNQLSPISKLVTGRDRLVKDKLTVQDYAATIKALKNILNGIEEWANGAATNGNAASTDASKPKEPDSQPRPASTSGKRKSDDDVDDLYAMLDKWLNESYEQEPMNENLVYIKNPILRAAYGFGTGAAIGAMAVAPIAVPVAVVKLINYLWKKHQSSKAEGKVTFAVITFVNETKPEGFAKVRLFVKNSATNFDIKGRDKIMNLKENMLKLAETLQNESDKITDTTEKDHLLTVSKCINVFFAGLTSK